jgi:hypothetical protein
MLIKLRLNLQYFSEDHPFAAEPTPVEPHPFAEDASESTFAKFAEGPNPLLADFQAPETPELQSKDQGQPEKPTAQELEELDFGGRKVPVVDPIITELHKDYSHLNRTYQQTSQELANARQIAEQWQQLAQQSQQGQQQSTPGEIPQTTNLNISAEREAELQEQYMERWYENKMLADKWWNEQPEIMTAEAERQKALFEGYLNERLAPIEAERDALKQQQQADQFLQSHPDFEDYRESMQTILDQNPNLQQLPNVLDVLYAMAKVQNAPQTPTVQDMITNPQYQQQILEDETILNMAFQKYQEKKLNVNQQLPNLMGSPTGSQTPMSAGERAPRSLADATRSWLRSTGQY